jgi:hypothetical protein
VPSIALIVGDMGFKRIKNAIRGLLTKLNMSGSHAGNVRRKQKSRQQPLTGGTARNAESVIRPRLKFTKKQLRELRLRAGICGVSLSEFIEQRIKSDQHLR